MDFLSSLENTQDLVSLPNVATKILSLLDNDNVHVRELASLVETDAPISLKVIRLANSPTFALRNEVTSVSQAVTTIGMNRMMNIVLGVSIYSKFVYLSNSSVGPFVQRFWEHSASTAGIAKALASSMKKNFQDNEFIGGLIHDIGKLCMIQYSADKYSEVLKLIEDQNMSDTDAEMEVFGATHTQVGQILSRTWKLPHALQNVVSCHDTPEAAGSDKGVTSIVRLADIVCEQHGHGIGEKDLHAPVSESSPWKNLCSLYPELRDFDINGVCGNLDDDFSKASAFLRSMLSN